MLKRFLLILVFFMNLHIVCSAAFSVCVDGTNYGDSCNPSTWQACCIQDNSTYWEVATCPDPESILTRSGERDLDSDWDSFFYNSQSPSSLACLDTLIDCNDTNAAIYPGAPENLTDGIDNSCDGVIDACGVDSNLCATVICAGECRSDCDGDGYPSAGLCTTDCDDNSWAIFPGASFCGEGALLDGDCDGVEDDWCSNGYVYDLGQGEQCVCGGGVYNYNVKILTPVWPDNENRTGSVEINYSVAPAGGYGSARDNATCYLKNCSGVENTCWNAGQVLSSNLLYNLNLTNTQFNLTWNLTSNLSYLIFCEQMNKTASYQGSYLDASAVEDLYYNNSFAPSDTDNPVVSLIFPTNDSVLLPRDLLFSWNVTDVTSNPRNCTLYLDDTANVTLSVSTLDVDYKQITEIADGAHNWSVGCYDTSNNSNSILSDTWDFTISSGKTTPAANQSKLDNLGIKRLSLYWIMNIEYWNGAAWQFIASVINDTSTGNEREYKAGNVTGLDTIWNGVAWDSSGQSSGTYRVIASAVDVSGTVLQDVSGTSLTANSNFTLTGGADTTLPYFTTIPANASLDYLVSLGVDFDAIDAVGFDSYVVNDSRFTINSSGYLQNGTILGVATYLLNITINDSSNNLNSTIYQVDVNQIDPSLSIFIDSVFNNKTIPNGTVSNVTCIAGTSQGNLNLTRNDSEADYGSLSVNETTIVGEGYYNYTCTYASTQNYSSNFTTLFLNATTTDVSGPAITLVSPTDSLSTTSTSISFTYNVSDDNDVSNCTLSIGASNYTNSSYVNQSATNTISATLSVASYTWNISCTDSLGNIENSSTRSLTITSSDTGGGDSGGGGCTPQCTGLECGDNGCGGTCGACSDGESCSSGVCEISCTDSCEVGEQETECISDSIARSRNCGVVGECNSWESWLATYCAEGETCSSGECITCEEEWVCDDWTSCIDGEQNRSCRDTQICGTEIIKPNEIQQCISGIEIDYFPQELDIIIALGQDLDFGVEVEDLAGEANIKLDWFVGENLSGDKLGVGKLSDSINYIFDQSEKVKVVIGVDGDLQEILWNVQINQNASLECAPIWHCEETDCIDGDSYSYPYDCVDLNDCGVSFGKPKREECSCYSSWTCGDWGECSSKYYLDDVVEGSSFVQGYQERICTDFGNCEFDRTERKDCELTTAISTDSVEWCDEEYVEVSDKITGELLSRMRRDPILEFSELERLDISLISTSFTGYCDYCFDGEKNHDERGVDCGGPSCPDCLTLGGFWNWLPIVIFISWLLFTILLINLILKNRSSLGNIGEWYNAGAIKERELERELNQFLRGKKAEPSKGGFVIETAKIGHAKGAKLSDVTREKLEKDFVKEKKFTGEDLTLSSEGKMRKRVKKD